MTAWNMAVLTITLLVLSRTSALRGPLALGSWTTPQEPADISAVLTSKGLASAQHSTNDLVKSDCVKDEMPNLQSVNRAS